MPSNAEYATRRSWGEALKRRRERQGYSQIMLSYKADLSSNAVTQYEKKGVIPSITVAYKLIKALDWDLESWASDAEKIYQDGSWFKERFDHDYKSK